MKKKSLCIFRWCKSVIKKTFFTFCLMKLFYNPVCTLLNDIKLNRLSFPVMKTDVSRGMVGYATRVNFRTFRLLNIFALRSKKSISDHFCHGQTSYGRFHSNLKGCSQKVTEIRKWQKSNVTTSVSLFCLPNPPLRSYWTTESCIGKDNAHNDKLTA